ncbi:chemotaxis protein [Roseibium sp. RKSG952]|uniref:chemotaxis protein n=1 Tax=Roseibium sp. RKSG952 TaxID=2529384 RepID=UPI0012BBE2AA|nr:chemotaxis protein [Roseibium sp. RKSG952]MTH98287.1 chemotaxis protein [Roseibium sp. RKSG952]
MTAQFMMRILFRAIALGVSFVALQLPVSAQVLPEKQPYEMVRTLQSLQAEVAQGNTHALAAQRALLLTMDEEFLLMPKEWWQEPRNARAAVIHLLSGGHPKVMRMLMVLEPAPNIDQRLTKAALAYVEGREQQVLDNLKDIDPIDLPPSLGGHVAVIKAAVILQTDPPAALKLLSTARLLMPGSLVEEAALRREVFVSASLGDVERFNMLSMRYLRRYGKSLYASDFRRRFAHAIDTLGFGQNPERFVIIESLISEFDRDTQRNLYLRLARSALLSGNLSIVEKATARGMPLAIAETHEAEVFKLYRAGALIDVENIKKTRDLLWSIDQKKLTESEKKLLEMVYSVVNNIRHFPDPPENVIGDFSIYLRMDDPRDPNWVTPVMSDAATILRSSGALMERMGSN